MTGHKKWLAVLSGAFALWMIGGCSLKNVENLQETGKILSETVEDISETSETDDGYISGDYDKEDLDAVWSESTSTMIQCDGKSISITGNGATADGTTVKITEAGDYVFSGSLEEGQIQIDADKEDMVHIILNGLTASSSSGAVIEGIQNEKMILTLAEGTTNTLSDASDYGLEEGDEGEPNACIFSKDDISVNGSDRQWQLPGWYSKQGRLESGKRNFEGDGSPAWIEGKGFGQRPGRQSDDSGRRRRH